MSTSTQLLAQSSDVFRRRASTFSLAAQLLTHRQREQATQLYSFCRLVDDIADECDDPRIADEHLYQLRREVLGVVSARPEVAAAMAILDASPGGRRPAIDLLQGAADDVGGHIVSSDAALRAYCYRVAGTVGLMMCPVIGVANQEAFRHAVDLGIGMQLTNLCRDVLEDSRNGRVYLPRTRLLGAGTTPEALLNGTADEASVAQVVLDLLEVADRYYERGRDGLGYIPLRPRMAIAVAARVYQAIGGVLRQRGGNAMLGRAHLTWSGRLWYAGKALVELLWRRPPAPQHESAAPA